MYEAGTVLKINMGGYFHYGIADDEGYVIHNSRKREKVTQDSYHNFSGGRIEKIEVSTITSDDPKRAVRKAKRCLNMAYDFFSLNCEHFVRFCHGLEIECTQLQHATAKTIGSAMMINGKNDYVKLFGGVTLLGSLFTPIEESPYKNIAIGVLAVAGIIALSKSV